ncbi:uncharacterized protein BX663DRAFT_500690 [Cokeromyces recurvatus]|uniref:uncharacterized protein n=1 Tax=Cokeromyces recurvatus TaxID=90255 RepID=UPI00221E8979|nr:uncharacterized protein BX663DRAFT_500690 [Cokeromyces recurvatus]KAI7905721.1 hypothetical protein BX663DRAFT_500690 [Cokeromyces recurvatus]
MTSISTPTTMLTNNLVEDPWSEIPIISKKDLISKQSPSHQDNFVPGMSSIEVPIITTEPSISSPLIVKTQDIEPQKRRAFADLIASWNTGQRNKNIEDSNHSHQFFEHIAEESRDIGFAGIEGNKDNTSHSQNQVIPPIMDWTEEENPWN